MFSRVLVLAPHTDDGELGCGGTISRFLEEGKEVFYAAFSVVEDALPEGFPPNALEVEMKNACNVLEIPNKNLLLYKYKVRTFSYHRQEILQDLYDLNKEINPDLIFIPSLNDLHQDHKTLAEEGRRMFKKNTILGYEEPWNNITFNTITFVILEKRHVERKVKALMCYETQRYRKYLNEDFIYALAKARGTQIEKEYAEAFEVIRWVI
jgi:LmbE family N-acetylglucosaminyl deacetylase